MIRIEKLGTGVLRVHDGAGLRFLASPEELAPLIRERFYLLAAAEVQTNMYGIGVRPSYDVYWIMEENEAPRPLTLVILQGGSYDKVAVHTKDWEYIFTSIDIFAGTWNAQGYRRDRMEEGVSLWPLSSESEVLQLDQVEQAVASGLLRKVR